MKRWPGGLAAVLVILGEPSVKADPGAMPDLSGYTLVNVGDYPKFYTYPGTGGVQFVTPGGYRCRLTYNMKPNVSMAECWGSLPATSSNYISGE